MPISKFDDETNEEKASESDSVAEKEYKSIRMKNRKKYSSEEGKDSNHNEKYSFTFTYDERVNYQTNFEDTREFLISKKFKLDEIRKQKIDEFLFTKAPVPRSYRMIGTNNIFR